MGGCAGWIEPCVRVSQRRWSRIGGPGKSDCVKLLLTGKWGGGEWVGVRRVRVQGSETNKEWSC